jgi:hypothetical protein
MSKNILKPLFFFVLYVSLTVQSAIAEPTLVSRALLGGNGKGVASAAAVSPNGEWAAVALSDRGIYTWSVAKREYAKRFLTNDYIDGLDIDNAGRIIAASSSLNIYLENLESGELEEIGKSRSRATAIKFGTKNRAILTENDHVELWALTTKNKIKETSAVGSIRDIQFNPDRTQFITNNYDTNSSAKKNTVTIFDTDSLNQLAFLETPAHGRVVTLFNQNGTNLALLQNRTLSISDNQFNPLVGPVQISDADTIAFHPNERWLWIGTNRQKIMLVDPYELMNPSTYIWPWTRTGFDAIEFSSSGQNVLTWSTTDGARWWFLPVEGTEGPEENDNGKFLIPQGSGSRRNNDLPCRLSANGTSIIVTNRGPYSEVFWRTYEFDDEIVSGGKTWVDSRDGVETQIAIEKNDRNQKCEAFYQSNSSAP